MSDKPEEIICPVCGYYCLGRGGHGCIDKPTLCGYVKTKTETEIRADERARFIDEIHELRHKLGREPTFSEIREAIKNPGKGAGA